MLVLVATAPRAARQFAMPPPVPITLAARALFFGAPVLGKRKERLPRSYPALAWRWQAGGWPGRLRGSPQATSLFLSPSLFAHLSRAGVPCLHHPIFLSVPNSRPRD